MDVFEFSWCQFVWGDGCFGVNVVEVGQVFMMDDFID